MAAAFPPSPCTSLIMSAYSRGSCEIIKVGILRSYDTEIRKSGEGNRSRMCTGLQKSWSTTPALDRWHRWMDWDEDQWSGYSSGRSWSLERDTTCRQPFLWRKALSDDDNSHLLQLPVSPVSGHLAYLPFDPIHTSRCRQEEVVIVRLVTTAPSPTYHCANDMTTMSTVTPLCYLHLRCKIQRSRTDSLLMPSDGDDVMVVNCGSQFSYYYVCISGP